MDMQLGICDNMPDCRALTQRRLVPAEISPPGLTPRASDDCRMVVFTTRIAFGTFPELRSHYAYSSRQ